MIRGGADGQERGYHGTGGSAHCGRRDPGAVRGPAFSMALSGAARPHPLRHRPHGPLSGVPRPRPKGGRTMIGTLRPALEREHRQWIEEVMGALEPAQRPDAGVWARWDALRYLQTTFSARLDRERRMVQGVMPVLDDVQRETLWALGELLDALRQQLDHLSGLCQRAEQFSAVTGRIVTALRHW